MAGDGIVVEGAAELDRTLTAAADHLVETSVNQQAAQALLDKAGPATPRVTGALAASGAVAADADGGTVTYDGVYAGVIHNGWPGHGIEAQPWLADTAASARTDLVDVYAGHITDLLAHVHGI